MKLLITGSSGFLDINFIRYALRQDDINFGNKEDC